MPMGEMRDEDRYTKPKKGEKCKHPDHMWSAGQTCPGCGEYQAGDPMG